MNATCTIKGRTYEITGVDYSEKHPRLAVDLINRGFDGRVYWLRGVCGAVHMAYKTSVHGQFVIAA